MKPADASRPGTSSSVRRRAAPRPPLSAARRRRAAAGRPRPRDGAGAAAAEKPLMSNHNRGLWGYTGETPEGRPLTVQSTGMGGPSAAIVLHELAELGVRRAIRVGHLRRARRDRSSWASCCASRRRCPRTGSAGRSGRRGRSRPIPGCSAASRRRGPARRRRSPPPTSSTSTPTRPGAAGSRRARPRSRWRPARCSRSAPGWGWRSPACWSSPTSSPAASACGSSPRRSRARCEEMGRAAAAALAG